nr:MAG TPA: hypothetical protein [Caudoviricetes sp.]
MKIYAYLCIVINKQTNRTVRHTIKTVAKI